ncbi:hypothetical protein HFP15_05510 [Amycolatopsis sp. K13G38]|uniref:Uncharacterized protein n=1 Tax=Amycolatopsis acididurans TaxID=2724524 RepID=A0ABX1IXV1_9PSEU|nr:hypothetical protein [Amycolatopsis acididurans]NKQ52333.1 hypothetical protein [Amycolatopsis acididurans]
MTEPGKRASLLDVAFGAAVITTSIGVRTCGALLRGLPQPRTWPWPLRTFGEIGYHQRLALRAEAERRYRDVVPALVTVVLDELDLPRIVNGVIDEIDLPEIIRTSTGSVAGGTVRDVRVQVMAADDTVSRWTRWLVTAGRDGRRSQR